MSEIDFPVRLNRYLALKGFATRRGADVLISSGRVLVNGRRAPLGLKLTAEDKVEVISKKPAHYRYFAYRKPKGIVSHSPAAGVKEIKQVAAPTGVFPVGRLDKNSHGLIILTDDGRITDRLLNPKFVHEKEYLVKVREKLRSSFKAKMEAGVDIGGYRTKPCKIKVVGDHSFRIVLTEGKKHQIKRMCAALFLTVVDLERIRIMNIRLSGTPTGEARELKGEELSEFLKKLQLLPASL